MPSLQLSFRDLLAIITLLAVLVAWWVDHRQLRQSQETIHEELIASQLDAAVSRAELQATEKILHAVIQELEPERIGADFHFRIGAGGGHGEQR